GPEAEAGTGAAAAGRGAAAAAGRAGAGPAAGTGPGGPAAPVPAARVLADRSRAGPAEQADPAGPGRAAAADPGLCAGRSTRTSSCGPPGRRAVRRDGRTLVAHESTVQDAAALCAHSGSFATKRQERAAAEGGAPRTAHIPGQREGAGDARA